MNLFVIVTEFNVKSCGPGIDNRLGDVGLAILKGSLYCEFLRSAYCSAIIDS